MSEELEIAFGAYSLRYLLHRPHIVVTVPQILCLALV